MHFRKALITDFPSLHYIRMSVRENILSNPALVAQNDYELHIKEKGSGWVCEVDGSIAGFSIINLESGNLWALFVLPEFEGRGIGRKLLELVINDAKDGGLGLIWLTTDLGTRAERLYTQAGWSGKNIESNGEVRFELRLP